MKRHRLGCQLKEMEEEDALEREEVEQLLAEELPHGEEFNPKKYLWKFRDERGWGDDSEEEVEDDSESEENEDEEE